LSSTIINLIIQLIGGAGGGNLFAKLTAFTLGRMGNTISGAVGGAIGGQLLQGLIPGLMGESDALAIGSLLGQLAIGGVSGAIFTVLISLLMNPIDY
jgi:hypothetical protein